MGDFADVGKVVCVNIIQKRGATYTITKIATGFNTKIATVSDRKKHSIAVEVVWGGFLVWSLSFKRPIPLDHGACKALRLAAFWSIPAKNFGLLDICLHFLFTSAAFLASGAKMGRLINLPVDLRILGAVLSIACLLSFTVVKLLCFR